MTFTDKTRRISATYSAALQQARGNDKLSDEGRRVAIAKAYRTARNDMAATRATLDADIMSRRSQLVAKAYGRLSSTSSGYDVVAFRDAEDRIANLKTFAEARAYFDRAEQSGDNGLATAIARHAEPLTTHPTEGRHWTALLQDYVNARPHLEATFIELGEIDDHLARGLLGNGLHFNVSVPEEIRDVAHNSVQVDRLADSA